MNARILLSLAALGLALYPLSAVGGQANNVDRIHNAGRYSCLEPDEQLERRTNAYLLIEGFEYGSHRRWANSPGF